MRSVYCVGVVRALADSAHLEHVRSVHTSSAGCVSGAALVGQLGPVPKKSVGETFESFLPRVVGTRFINQRRYSRVVDVDYLVTAIQQINKVSLTALRSIDTTFEVALTNAATAGAAYVDLATCWSDAEISTVLTATMAIPVLYHRPVKFRGLPYVDGGIADPLPVVRALSTSPDVVIAISSVATGELIRPLAGLDARVVRFIPGMSEKLRHLMLTRNPLADLSESILAAGEFQHTKVVHVAPTDRQLLGSRLETDEGKLRALEQLGYRDGTAAFAGFTP